MRMWMLPTSCMCMQHIVGEHGEIHKHRHNFVKGHSIAGRIGQIEPEAMQHRHDELARALKNHNSPYTLPDLSGYDLTDFTVDLNESARDLANRCPKCRELLIENGGFTFIEE